MPRPILPASARAQDSLRTAVAASGIVPVVLLVLVVMLILAAIGVVGPGRRARRAAAVLLVPASVGWVLFNGPIEGPVLLTLTPEHGVTVSDLLGLLGLVVAASVLLRRR